MSRSESTARTASRGAVVVAGEGADRKLDRKSAHIAVPRVEVGEVAQVACPASPCRADLLADRGDASARPLRQHGVDQRAAVGEMPVEAALGDGERLGQRLDPHRFDAAIGQRSSAASIQAAASSRPGDFCGAVCLAPRAMRSWRAYQSLTMLFLYHTVPYVKHTLAYGVKHDDPTNEAFKPRDPDWEARVRESFARQALYDADRRRDRVACAGPLHALRCARGPNLCQQRGFLHGGVTTALADTAAGFAAYSLMPEGSSPLTVELKINLMSPAVGRAFRRQAARSLRSGRTLTIVEVDVERGSAGRNRN